jgi:periplasmic protein TonB
MERPGHLTVRTRRFSPRNVVAISGALLLEAAALYFVATSLTFDHFRFFTQALQVEFLTKPPKEPPVVLPRLQLVEPPIPTVAPPEIQIQTPRPPPHIKLAKMTRHPVMPAAVVQVARLPVPPAPPKPQGITAPVSIGASHSCETRYPPTAVRLNQQGTTTIKFTVNTDGSVANVHVAKSSGHEMLDEAAIGCALSWRYRPALEEGRPVPAAWTTNVQWKLRNGSPST